MLLSFNSYLKTVFSEIRVRTWSCFPPYQKIRTLIGWPCLSTTRESTNKKLGFWRGKAWTHVLNPDLRKNCLKFQDCLEIDLKTSEKRPRPPGKFGQNWFSLTKLLSRLWWHSSKKRAFVFDYISQWIFLKIWKLVVFSSSFFIVAFLFSL